MILRNAVLGATFFLSACGGGSGGSSGGGNGGGGTPPPPPPAVSVTVSPPTASIQVGATQQFTCAVANSNNQQCNWTVEGGGGITPAGLYTAPGVSGTATIKATAAADSSKSASAAVTVTAAPPPVVTVGITPATVTLAPSGTQDFSCTVTGSTNTACTFSLQAGDAGSVTPAGRYTAPTTAGTAHVIATATADPSKKATATVTIGATAAATPWVTGYYAGWYWPYASPADVDMSGVTHFVFGRAAPGCGTLKPENGPCVPEAVTPGAGTGNEAGSAPDGRSVEDYLIDRAHQAGAKALLMLGGMGDGEGFHLASADNNVRARFVKNLVDYAIQHNYDGIDVDWEDELGPYNSLGLPEEETYRRLIALLTDLRAEANGRARYQNPQTPFLMTFPGYGKNLNIDSVQDYEVTVANMVDQYNMMNYGIGSVWFGGGWETWFSSPIYGESPTHNTSLSSSVDLYVARGVPRSKLGVGIGFYGIYYVAPLTGPDLPVNEWWQVQMDDNALSFRNLHDMGYFSNGTLEWDDRAQSSYRSYGEAGYVPASEPTLLPAGYLSYENTRSLQAKADWVKGSGLGGVILWTIDYGYIPGNGPQGQGGKNPLLENVKCSFLNRGCAQRTEIQ